MNEKTIQKKIKKWLKEAGPLVIKYPAGNPRLGAEVGVPDLIGVHSPSGRMLALEVKTEVGRPTRKQIYVLEELAKRGAISGIVRSIEDVEELFRNHGLS